MGSVELKNDAIIFTQTAWILVDVVHLLHLKLSMSEFERRVINTVAHVKTNIRNSNVRMFECLSRSSERGKIFVRLESSPSRKLNEHF